MYEKNSAGYYKNRHSCFLLSYHLVLVTKYRNPVLTGEVKELVYDTIRAGSKPVGSCPGDQNKDFPLCEKPL
jgi:hypothetical protein